MTRSPQQPARLPAHFWLGLGLVAVVWPVNWALPGMRTHLLFFPLWLGYCLVLDGLVAALRGTSPLTRGRWAYVWLYVLSVPGWWLFELIDLRTQNWFYVGREHVSDIVYVLLASLSFSTVMPAVFTSAELVGCLLPSGGPARTDRRISHPALLGALAAGVVMLILVIALPGVFFPLVWVSLFFIFDPLNALREEPSLLVATSRGQWRTVWALWGGVMLCAFFWEMWNFYSYPKWIYRVPFVGQVRLFEMPVLGYMGYLPFALELYALFHLLTSAGPARAASRVIDL